MAIERVSATIARTQELPYTTFLNSTIELINDSDAMAIYTYLQTKNAKWVVRREDVMKKFSIGKHRYTKAMSYLRSLGLVERRVQRDDQGKVIDNQLVIHYQPEENSRSTDSPDTGSIGNPDERESGELGHLENDQFTSNESSSSNNSFAPSTDGACKVCGGTGSIFDESRESLTPCKKCQGTGQEPQPPAKPEKPKRKTKAEKLFDKLRTSGYMIAQASDDVLTEWCKLRVKKGASDSDLVHKRIDGQLRILINHGMTIDAALTEQVARNWTDLKAEWFDVMKGRLPNQQQWEQQTQSGWSAGCESEMHRGEK